MAPPVQTPLAQFGCLGLLQAGTKGDLALTEFESFSVTSSHRTELAEQLTNEVFAWFTHFLDGHK